MPTNLSNGANFNKTEAQNMRLHNVGTRSSAPVAGQIEFDTGDGYIYYRDASTWRQIMHYTAIVALRLHEFAIPTASLNLNNQRIINLLDPSNAQDAATKAYVDAAIAGLKWKETVRLAATTAITLSGLSAIDGVTPVAGDRIARMDNSASAGIYIASAGAWTRANDADTGSEMVGACFFVSEGTVNGNAQYVCTTDSPITLGSTALVFAKIGAGVTYTAGTGISIAGSVLSLDLGVAVRKALVFIGNGSATSFTITHGLTSQNLTVSLMKVSTGESWLPDWGYTGGSSTSQITLNFGFAPTTNEFFVVIHG